MAGSRDNGGGLSFQTLVIASLASATAAVVVSQFWKGGTIMSAAITPVIVAIVSELLHRPAKQVTRFTSATRERPARGESRGHLPGEPSIAGLERLGGEVASARRGSPPPPDGPRPGAMRVHRPPRRRLHWRVALATGLLAFVIAAVVVTLPELISGSAALGDRSTTFFGGGETQEQSRDDRQEEQPSDEAPDTTTAPDPEQQPDGGSAPPEETQPPQEQPPADSQPQQTPPPETQPPQSQPAP